MQYLPSLVLILIVLFQGTAAWARFIDEAQTLRVNGRVYNRMAMAVEDAADFSRLQTPYNSFNMLQSRTFVQMELRHDLIDLVNNEYEGNLNILAPIFAPFRVLGLEDLSYFMTYRGEYDGVWDYGPDVFSERYPVQADCGPVTKQTRSKPRTVAGCTRSDTRRALRNRHRLFEAYVDLSWETLFIRIGRQNLSWGETDAFRLLDQINPLDASFGGFLVSLDDRRVPLDMARIVYSLEDIGPFSELNLEAFGVLDDAISVPTPAGSPWSVPNPPGIRGYVKNPARNITDSRGGFRVSGRIGDLTLSAAHYYTFLDAPMVQVVTPTDRPVSLAHYKAAVEAGEAARFLVDNFQANVRFPKIAISGATASFSLPRLDAIVRSEVAIFWREYFTKNSGPSAIFGPALEDELTPGFRQVGVGPDSSRLLSYKSDIDRSHVIRWVLGLDVNRYIRSLNPQQSFIFSGQFFATHILDFDNTPLKDVRPYGFGHYAVGVVDPNHDALVEIDQHQFVNTFSVSTSFRSGVIAPQLVFFYDWQGSWLVQPGVTLTRDPFRLTLQYNYLDGQFNGIGFLRDRDNLIAQMEMVF